MPSSADSTPLLERARAGFAPIELPAAIKEAALGHLEEWVAEDKFAGILPASAAPYLPVLSWLADAEKFDLLLDSFYQVMPFGTGGRRGPVGLGPNRINPYTIASSVQGHVEYLRTRLGDEDLRVVVAYDVREYNDLRGIYPEGLANPVMGMSSKDFAHIAASVYAAAGVTVFMLPDEPADFISTPELSFLIRRFGAHGGLNVSASHNHPDDNGGKFYNDKGGQEIPPYDEEMVKIVETITSVESIDYAEALAEGKIRPIEGVDREAYVQTNLRLATRDAAGSATFVFTGLHGTGVTTVCKCLEAMGYAEGEKLHIEPTQREYRGDFANVKFRTPNPEVPLSMERAVALAKDVGGDVVLATDPDADRLGAFVEHDGAYVFLNGNELAIVTARYRLETLKARGELSDRALVIKTQVTSELLSRMAEALGAQVIGDLLVGFKYIGNILDHLDRTGRFGDVEASLDDFVIGCEESHGLLLTGEIRDKDAAGAAVVLADLMSDLKEKGSDVYAYLIEAYKKYGYHRNFLRSTIMQGAAGAAKIREIQQALRDNPPAEVDGRKVLDVIDYWDEERFGPFVSETDRSSRNLIGYRLEGQLRAIIRPSGTEPKNKIYLERREEPIGEGASDEEFTAMKERVDAEVEAFSNEFLASMLGIIGVKLPGYALAISDLVTLENKQDFAERVVPGLEKRAAEGMGATELGAWFDGAIAGYGPDARLLVELGVKVYLGDGDAPDAVRAVLG